MDEHDVKKRFDRVDARFVEMQQLILQEGERTREHFDVVARGLSERIGILGEGYEALRTDVTELKQGQARLERGQSALELHMMGVEARVVTLEKVQKVVLTEVRGLATKVDRFTRVRRGRP